MMESTNAVIVRTQDEHGSLAFLVTNKEDSIQRCHAKGAFYEEEDLRAISEHISGQGAIWDIGANVGNHTIYLARRFPNCCVVAFEMVPQTCEILRVNIALNDLRHVDLSHLGCALGKAPGRCTFEARHVNNMGLVRAIPSDDGDIQIVTGDSLADDNPLSFVKVDVEGAELDVLEGMSQTIARDRPVIFIEVDNRNASRFDAWLASNQYEIIHTIKRYSINTNYLVRPV